MEGQTDKMNYRGDVQLMILRNHKTFLIINKNIFKVSMHDIQTDGHLMPIDTGNLSQKFQQSNKNRSRENRITPIALRTD